MFNPKHFSFVKREKSSLNVFFTTNLLKMKRDKYSSGMINETKSKKLK